MKQMNALEDEGLVDADSVVELLENKIALIVPKDSTLGITGFEDITKAEKIALGDPESVPVGQYSKEAFENLGMWDDVEAKTSFGTNVTEVLSWVAAGSADAGIVYLTDATTSDQFDQVKVIGYAPEGSVSKVIYPVGVVSASTKKDAAQKFVDYLETDDAPWGIQKENRCSICTWLCPDAAAWSIFRYIRDVSFRYHGASISDICCSDAADPSGNRSGRRTDHGSSALLCL